MKGFHEVPLQTSVSSNKFSMYSYVLLNPHSQGNNDNMPYLYTLYVSRFLAIEQGQEHLRSNSPLLYNVYYTSYIKSGVSIYYIIHRKNSDINFL